MKTLRLSLYLVLVLVSSNIFFNITVSGQNSEQIDSLSLIFMGDIMGHGPQIRSAYDPNSKTYNYKPVFEKVAPIIQSADFAIANLEVTLAGAPYRGYPSFSSPNELASACKENGIDVLVTANNHSCDKGKKGIVKTIKTLNSLGISHTGTFLSTDEQKKNNLLVLSKNNIRVGLLNYTYGTNGIRVPKSTFVNQTDTIRIKSDIEASKKKNLDKLIVFLHWGNEYQSQPSKTQIKMADFLFTHGVDIIIGSHPHVLQRMESRNNGEQIVVYSLGNFVSNQRNRKTDGGAMFQLLITKQDEIAQIARSGYHLTWVHKFKKNGKYQYQILPCSKYELDEFKGLDNEAKKAMKLFMYDSRALLNKENIDTEEIKARRRIFIASIKSIPQTVIPGYDVKQSRYVRFE